MLDNYARPADDSPAIATVLRVLAWVQLAAGVAASLWAWNAFSQVPAAMAAAGLEVESGFSIWGKLITVAALFQGVVGCAVLLALASAVADLHFIRMSSRK